MRRKLVTFLATLGMAAGLLVVTPAKADAAFIGWICNDAGCLGGDDFSVSDGSAGDNLGGFLVHDGVISFGEVNAFGFEIVANLSQSKPALVDGMDLNFTVTNAAGTPGGTIWLYATDTGFFGPATVSGEIGGTKPTTGTVTALLCGGTGILGGQFAINSSCESSTFGPSATRAFSGAVGPLLATSNPYALAIGVAVTIGDNIADTTTGDLRVIVAPERDGRETPEPASLGLFGLALVGLRGAVRRRFNA